MSLLGLQNQCKEKIQLTKLQRLKKEEEVLKKVLKKYQDGLHALQIEELTIKYELGKRRTHDNDTLNNSVPQSIADFKTFISVDPSHLNEVPDGDGQCVSQKSLNQDVTPLKKLSAKTWSGGHDVSTHE
ncbi:uncharacterized protein LOC123504740 isoform X2 [Portunus trituberculatus]|uniref:uncharacterized protein LOC123504740 isoform X2 n=1 Tax=Portunus trituberculatus TaxID=210409 RepID=UPI001E1D08AF|nr:uncharacterized protein LOC123504740 isoform X2 [Portunus trituberculatus]